MNVKKEIFESLRLDLQEFAPQEFVATCYSLTVYCESPGKIWEGSTSGTSHEHHSHNQISYVLISTTNGPSGIINAQQAYGGQGKGNAKPGYAWAGFSHFVSSSSISNATWNHDTQNHS